VCECWRSIGWAAQQVLQKLGEIRQQVQLADIMQRNPVQAAFLSFDDIPLVRGAYKDKYEHAGAVSSLVYMKQAA